MIFHVFGHLAAIHILLNFIVFIFKSGYRNFENSAKICKEKNAREFLFKYIL